MVFICQYVGCSLFSDVEFELNEDEDLDLGHRLQKVRLVGIFSMKYEARHDLFVWSEKRRKCHKVKYSSH